MSVCVCVCVCVCVLFLLLLLLLLLLLFLLSRLNFYFYFLFILGGGERVLIGGAGELQSHGYTQHDINMQEFGTQGYYDRIRLR